MSKSIRLSDELIEKAREQAILYHRSPPQQIEHWAEIGRVMEPTLSYGVQTRVKKVATDSAIEEALERVGTPEGIRRVKEVIARTSGSLER